MAPSRLRPGSILLKLVCAGLLLGGAAQARNDACDVAPNPVSAACLARVARAEAREVNKAAGETIAAATGVGSAAAGAALALWQPERRIDGVPIPEPRPTTEAELAVAAGANEPPLLGLLLAVLGVVSFVAHRRTGR